MCCTWVFILPCSDLLFSVIAFFKFCSKWMFILLYLLGLCRERKDVGGYKIGTIQLFASCIPIFLMYRPQTHGEPLEFEGWDCRARNLGSSLAFFLLKTQTCPLSCAIDIDVTGKVHFPLCVSIMSNKHFKNGYYIGNPEYFCSVWTREWW